MGDLSGRGIVKGMGSMGYGEQTALAGESGVQRQRLNGLLNGREGISLAACKALSGALEHKPNPHAMFVEGHVAALKHRDATPAETLGVVSFVLKTLEAEAANLHASKDLEGAVAGLHRVGEAAIASVKREGATGSGSMSSLDRSSTGVATKKRYDPRTQDEPITPAEKSERPGRNPDGTSNRKLAM